MKMEIFELGKTVKDKVTGMEGHLSHALINPEHTTYIFQPKEVLESSGKMAESIHIPGWRVVGGKKITGEVPIEILGKTVTDTTLGVKGIALQISIHINKCVHVWVQQKGATASFEEYHQHDCYIDNLTGKCMKGNKILEFVKEVKSTPRSPASQSYVV
jgi:hypothetical protein